MQPSKNTTYIENYGLTYWRTILRNYRTQNQVNTSIESQHKYWNCRNKSFEHCTKVFNLVCHTKTLKTSHPTRSRHPAKTKIASGIQTDSRVQEPVTRINLLITTTGRKRQSQRQRQEPRKIRISLNDNLLLYGKASFSHKDENLKIIHHLHQQKNK